MFSIFAEPWVLGYLVASDRDKDGGTHKGHLAQQLG
jgi:hypothetical protein